MNEVQLIGNVGNEPSFSETKDEVYAKFKMATDFTYTTSQKVKVKRTEWHIISVKTSLLVEKVRKNIHTGAYVMVEGHIFTERWNDENTGEERFQKVIQATSLRILGKSKKFEQGPEVGEPANTPVE